MNYYNFRNSAEPSEIGWVPQSQIRKGVNPRDADSVWNVQFDKFPDFLPNVVLELVPRAKLTDMISSVAISHGYMVNEKLMSLIKSHNLPNHAFYPGKLHTKNGTFTYYWFHFITNGFWDWVDRENSKLTLRSIIPDQRDHILEEVNLLRKTNVDFMTMANNMPMLTQYYWDKIVFNAHFPRYDIFSTLAPNHHTLISEKLYQCLLENNVTGFQINKLCEIIVPENEIL